MHALPFDASFELNLSTQIETWTAAFFNHVVTILRPFAGSPVALLSDGSATPHILSWGAVVVDSEGLLAWAYGGVMCDCSYSWAAEWLGKWCAFSLARLARVPPDSIYWSAADNVSAAVSTDAGRPSKCVWIDQIRLAFAQQMPSHLQEGFVPAEHDTHSAHAVAKWQAVCHELANRGSAVALPNSYPYPGVLDGLALLFRQGRLVVNVAHSMASVYNELHMDERVLSLVARTDNVALCAWASFVEEGSPSAGTLRFVYWMRSAPVMHVACDTSFKCSLCNLSCCGWGVHPGIYL